MSGMHLRVLWGFSSSHASSCTSEWAAGGEEGKPKGSRFRGKQAGAEAEGNLLNMPGKVVLKGQASSVLSAALAGKADAADALSCRGIFDR